MRKIISLLVAAALMSALCGTAFATETTEQEEEPADVEVMTGPGPVILEDSFFSDTVTTYVEDAKTIKDITSGIGDGTYAVGTASADTLICSITADSDIVSAVTFDASGMDFDTVGEYGVVYRVFISTEALMDYIEENDLTDVEIPDTGSDFIDICIPATVTIVDGDEDIETAEAEEESSDDVIIAEINELTWTYDQINSIPEVVAGIGSIESNAEDVEFDVDAIIVDAVIYDTSRLDTENPDADDVAYYTYFNREPLLDYMEEAGLDPADYPGLEDATTDYIMVYYGPITELALADVIDGLTDHYVLVDSENIDYGYGVTYNDDVVKEVAINSEGIDLSEVGTYNVEYVVTIDKNALEKVKNDGQIVSDNAEETETEDDVIVEEAEPEEVEAESEDVETEDAGSEDTEPAEEDLEDIIIDKKVDVVDEETADELVKEGETVWTDDNELYGEPADTETSAKTDTADTEVATNDTASADSNKSDGNANSSTESSSSSSNSVSSSSSGNSNSGSSSSESSSGNTSSNTGNSNSGSTQTHTHNYTGTVTKSATCTSNGTKTYTCSCGASYTESIPATGHNWVETYHEATGHYETVKVSDGYWEYPDGGYYKCNTCGYTCNSNYDMGMHCAPGEPHENGSSWTFIQPTPIWHDAEYEQQWVQDSGAYTSYYCSVCGATK